MDDSGSESQTSGVTSGAALQTVGGQSFEQALADLQGIVQTLESGDQGLDASLVEFERGIGLLRTCYRLLDAAEQRIEMLTGFDADGRPQLAPFDSSSTVDQREQSAGRRAAAEGGSRAPVAKKRATKAAPPVDAGEAEGGLF